MDSTVLDSQRFPYRTGSERRATILTRSGELTYNIAYTAIRARRCRSGRSGTGRVPEASKGCSSSGMVACTRARGSPGRTQESKRPSIDAARREREAQGMLRNADRCEDRSRGPRAVTAPQERGDASRGRLERNRAESIGWQQKNGLLGGGPAHTRPTRAYAHARTTERTAGTVARTCLCHDRI